MEHAKVNGVELEYEVVGSGEAMLLIHGAHLADALQPLVAEPALERFQRIRYHRRGLGGSTYQVDAGPTSVAVQAEDAAGKDGIALAFEHEDGADDAEDRAGGADGRHRRTVGLSLAHGGGQARPARDRSDHRRPRGRRLRRRRARGLQPRADPPPPALSDHLRSGGPRRPSG